MLKNICLISFFLLFVISLIFLYFVEKIEKKGVFEFFSKVFSKAFYICSDVIIFFKTNVYQKILSKILTKQEVKNKTKYYSLSPMINVENLALYKESFESVLSDTIIISGKKVLRNKNIALTGGYATGKSSLVRTYFMGNKRVIYVSIASYLDECYQENMTKRTKMEEKNFFNGNTENLEKCILHQILYETSPFLLPLSRVYRRDYNKFYFFISNLGISFLVTFLLYSFSTFFKITDNIFSYRPYHVYFPLIGVCIFYIVYKIRPKLKLNRISIDKLELSKEQENNNESLLNKYIDEIIHMFKFSKYNIVVFEDIDRIEKYKLQLFSRLKDMNFLINKSLRSDNKEVQFIYLVQDSSFKTPYDKVKFFDAIIDVIPFYNVYTSNSLLKKTLSEVCSYQISDEILNDASVLLNDPRIMYDVVNQFKLLSTNYENRVGNIEEEDINQILYLSIYKVLYPKRYEKIYYAKGPLSYYFSPDYITNLSAKIKTDIEKEMKKTSASISSLRALNILNREDLYNFIIKILKSFFNVNRIYNVDFKFSNGIFFRIDKNIINSFFPSDFFCCADKIEVIYKDNCVLLKEVIEKETNLEYGNFVGIINILVDFKNISFLEDRKISLINSLNSINYHNINITDKLKKLKLMLKEKEVRKLYDIDTVSDIIPFEEKLIINNIIKDNYSSIISRDLSSSSSNDPHDAIVLRKIRDNHIQTFDLEITDIRVLFKNLSNFDYALDSICLYALFEYLFEVDDNSRKKYLEQFFSNLTIHKIKFIISLSDKQADEAKKNVFTIFSEFFNDIWKFVGNNLSNFDSEGIIGKLLINTIYYCKPQKLNSSSTFYNQIINYPNIDSLIEKYLDDACFIANFKEFKNIKYTDSAFDNKNTKFIEFVYQNDMYENDLGILNNLCYIDNINYSDKTIFSCILALKETRNKLYKKYANNIYYILKKYERKINLEDSYDDIKRVYEDEVTDWTYNQLLYILNLKKEQIEDISWIPGDLYNDLLKNNKVAPLWENIYLIFKQNDNSFGDLLEKFFVDNFDAITSVEMNNDKYDWKLNSLLNLSSLTDEQFEILVSIYSEFRHFIGIPNYSDFRLNILLKYNMICLSEENKTVENIHLILENKDLSEIYKKKFVQLHEDYIYYTDGIIKDSNIFRLLINSDVDEKYKSHIIEKYNNTELFSLDVQRDTFELVKNNEVFVSKDVIMNYLIKLDVEPLEKEKLIMNNQLIIGDELVNTLEFISEDYSNLVKNKKSYISRDDYLFLKLLASKNLITSYEFRKNVKKPLKYYVKI